MYRKRKNLFYLELFLSWLPIVYRLCQFLFKLFTIFSHSTEPLAQNIMGWTKYKCVQIEIKLPLSWRRYVCLFVCGLSSHSNIFHSYGNVIITVEGHQILSYTRHRWPLSNESSLACHTYCDTGDLYNCHLWGPVKLTPIAECLAVKLSLPVFTT